MRCAPLCSTCSTTQGEALGAQLALALHSDVGERLIWWQGDAASTPLLAVLWAYSGRRLQVLAKQGLPPHQRMCAATA